MRSDRPFHTHKTASVAAKRKKSPKKKLKKSVENVLTREWNIAEMVRQFPQTVEVLSIYQLYCAHCQIGGHESLEDGCRAHGFPEEDIDMLLDDLNEAVRTMPARPRELIITKEAAEAIAEIQKGEGFEGKGLSIQAQSDGSFCMEFREKPEEDELEFSHPDVPEAIVWASLLTLQRIGGSKIAYSAEGGFSLETRSKEDDDSVL